MTIIGLGKRGTKLKKIVDEHKKLQIYSVMSIYSNNVLQCNVLNTY